MIKVGEKLADQVYEELRSLIISGDLQSGSIHSVSELAERFGVSRTPVREAALRLEAHGMLAFERNTGMRITEIGPKDILEIMCMRLALEPPMARMSLESGPSGALLDRLRECLREMSAAAQVEDYERFYMSDQRFHEYLLAGSELPHVLQTIDHARTRMVAWRIWTGGRTRSLDAVQIEHEHIYDAVEAGDKSSVVAAMISHIKHTGSRLIDQLGDAEVEEGWRRWCVAVETRNQNSGDQLT
jgi:DNA-binding GntR family transcriptional regulator